MCCKLSNSKDSEIVYLSFKNVSSNATSSSQTSAGTPSPSRFTRLETWVQHRPYTFHPTATNRSSFRKTMAHPPAAFNQLFAMVRQLTQPAFASIALLPGRNATTWPARSLSLSPMTRISENASSCCFVVSSSGCVGIQLAEQFHSDYKSLISLINPLYPIPPSYTYSFPHKSSFFISNLPAMLFPSTTLIVIFTSSALAVRQTPAPPPYNSPWTAKEFLQTTVKYTIDYE